MKFQNKLEMPTTDKRKNQSVIRDNRPKKLDEKFKSAHIKNEILKERGIQRSNILQSHQLEL